MSSPQEASTAPATPCKGCGATSYRPLPGREGVFQCVYCRREMIVEREPDRGESIFSTQSRQARELRRRARAAGEGRDWTEAARLWGRLDEMLGGNPGAHEAARYAQARGRAARIEGLLAQGRIEEAAAALQEARQEYPRDSWLVALSRRPELRKRWPSLAVDWRLAGRFGLACLGISCLIWQLAFWLFGGAGLFGSLMGVLKGLLFIENGLAIWGTSVLLCLGRLLWRLVAVRSLRGDPSGY